MDENHTKSLERNIWNELNEKCEIWPVKVIQYCKYWQIGDRNVGIWSNQLKKCHRSYDDIGEGHPANTLIKCIWCPNASFPRPQGFCVEKDSFGLCVEKDSCGLCVVKDSWD